MTEAGLAKTVFLGTCANVDAHQLMCRPDSIVNPIQVEGPPRRSE
jgi:hypothetical protein